MVNLEICHWQGVQGKRRSSPEEDVRRIGKPMARKAGRLQMSCTVYFIHAVNN